MQRSFEVDFGQVFPFGVYKIGEVVPVKDFDRSTKELQVQATDDSGVPVWSIEVIDGDPEARQRTVKVKITAPVKPLLPDGSKDEPFTAIAFEGLSVTPYLDTNGPRPRLAMSLRATSIASPSRRRNVTAA